MHYKIIAFGKPSLSYARSGIAEYRTRMTRFAKVEELFIREGKDPLTPSQGGLRIVLDERGQALTTRQWAETLKSLQGDSVKQLSFIIGAADGHAPAIRQAADHIWQLAPMTLNHELALLVLWEQLYRAHCLLAGHPYHRE